MQSKSRGKFFRPLQFSCLRREGRSFGRRFCCRTGTRAMGSGRRRSRGDGRLRGAACSRRAAGRCNGVKGTKSCNGEYTDNAAAEEDAHRSAGECGAERSPVLARLKVVSTSYDDPQRHGTSGAVATRRCDHTSTGKFLEIPALAGS